MERHVEVVSDLWTAKELIAGVHDVLLDVMPAVALAAVAECTKSSKQESICNQLAKLHLIEI